MNRRRFLSYGFMAGVAGFFTVSAYSKALAGFSPTPPEIEGPFYPVIAQKDKDFDLTRLEGKEGLAKGEPIIIQGQVLDTTGQPLEDVVVDLWQANAAGRYAHPADRNKAPLDPNFQGWAVVPSGKEGKFRFRTVKPGAYPASFIWTRPPHIHFKVSKQGYMELVTQMYFPGEKLNAKDRLLKRKSKKEREQMIAERIKGKPDIYNYNIILEKA